VLRDWLDRAVPALAAARERIDAVNVFPVPDGDTGTNVLLTVRGAADEVAALIGPELGWDEAATTAEISAYREYIAARLEGEATTSDDEAASRIATASEVPDRR
jgi:hypothetical protein